MTRRKTWFDQFVDRINAHPAPEDGSWSQPLEIDFKDEQAHDWFLRHYHEQKDNRHLFNGEIHLVENAALHVSVIKRDWLEEEV